MYFQKARKIHPSSILFYSYFNINVGYRDCIMFYANIVGYTDCEMF